LYTEHHSECPSGSTKLLYSSLNYSSRRRGKGKYLWEQKLAHWRNKEHNTFLWTYTSFTTLVNWMKAGSVKSIFQLTVIVNSVFFSNFLLHLTILNALPLNIIVYYIWFSGPCDQNFEFKFLCYITHEPGSSVSIVSDYRLDSRGSIPDRGFFF
jgi:hypothetical protein